ncbi:SNF2 domain-containing protein [Striga asiatica]|uniref:SNF2 domain-containing protein n=1 Tax=Striga asiatica TaxID=4170 RepID=A0A5A7PNM3_STRAF|nr:SNF2 domain-containing protein [Striga asiatica]
MFFQPSPGGRRPIYCLAPKRRLIFNGVLPFLKAGNEVDGISPLPTSTVSHPISAAVTVCHKSRWAAVQYVDGTGAVAAESGVGFWLVEAAARTCTVFGGGADGRLEEVNLPRPEFKSSLPLANIRPESESGPRQNWGTVTTVLRHRHPPHTRWRFNIDLAIADLHRLPPYLRCRHCMSQEPVGGGSICRRDRCGRSQIWCRILVSRGGGENLHGVRWRG